MLRPEDIRLQPLPDEALARYRDQAVDRLRHSYTRYQHMEEEQAAVLASRRVQALVVAAAYVPGQTKIAAILARGTCHGVLAYGINQAEGHLFLWDIVIESASRRQGIGRAAVRRLEELATAEGLASIRLNVEPGNLTSQAFFHSLGYETVALTKARRLDVG
jgi:ribosomal protein S18 acetylase RimI-like enzyme